MQLYSSANVLINPTYADTFPTINLEALACGTPVVTYRTGGSPEAIDTNTGIVVEQGDVAAMASAVVNICNKGQEAFLLSVGNVLSNILIRMSALKIILNYTMNCC